MVRGRPLRPAADAQILARLRELDVSPSRITLICIGEHVGIPHFGGLGELSPEQLGRLPASAAIKLTSAALDLAARAWAALRAPAPTGLNAIATTTSPELRFLGEAFGRLGREYPSTRDGLSVTERRILGAVAGGAPDAGAAFTSTGAREARPFLGDTWCYDAMIRLARAPSPLLRIAPLGRMVDGTHTWSSPRSRATSLQVARTTSRSTASTAGSGAST